MWTILTEYKFFQNSILDYLLALAFFIVGSWFLRMIKKFFLTRLGRWAKRRKKELASFLINSGEQNLLPLIYLGVFYLSIHRLILTPFLNKIINSLCLALLVFFGVRFLLALFNRILDYYLLKRETEATKRYAFRIISKFFTILVWILAFIVFLDNLGVEISALVAGLGIGWIAVALAAQDLLSDLFSYFTIYFDRPFEVGDYIIVDNFSGTVEHIGLKTTRLRSLTGEELVFPNADLTSSRLRNYKTMKRRRISFTIGVSYQTDAALVKEIPQILADIVNSIPGTELNRSHFSGFGEYSLRFEVVYYVLTRDYIKYMDIQQEINLKIIEEFSKRGIQFSYPTQTLYLKNG